MDHEEEEAQLEAPMSQAWVPDRDLMGASPPTVDVIHCTTTS